MEAIGAVSSVIAVVDLSAKIIILCSQYLTAVVNARADIVRLQEQVKNLETTLRHASHLLEQPLLSASRELDDPLEKCQDELQRLQAKLEFGAARKAMRRFGLRAVSWPFNKGDVEDIITSLIGYRDAITAILQIDQTKLLLSINSGIESLSLQTAENTSADCKSHFIIPFPRDPDYVDRPTLRTWLEEQYASPARRVSLVGLGGFGKSQIVIEFAHRVHIASPDTSVFWVHGSTEARFEESYRSLADALTLPRRHDPNVNILALVRDWLQREEMAPWLIILDNADNMETFFPKSQNKKEQREPLASYLPKTGNGKIVITSRSISIAEKLTGSHKTIREVTTMDSLEALQIFRNKLSGDIDQDAAVDLVHALDFIPLAVNQAAAYINRRAPRVSIRSYLDDFQQSERHKKSLLNRDAGDLRRHEEVSNSVVVTWQVTFEQIRQESPAAGNLLLLMSFFQPHNIPEFMLSGYNIITSDCGDGNSDNGEDLEDDLDILRAYSLISLSTTSGFCEMHSLVQFCTQVWLSEFNGDDFARLKRLFLSLGAKYFPNGNFETWAECQILLPHIQSLLDEEPIDEVAILDWSELLANVSWYMLRIGDYSAAESAGQKALQSRKRVLGDEHPDTLESMVMLTSTFWEQGRLAESELLEVQIVETKKRVLGDEHPDTLISMGNLASTYRDQGRLTKAELLEAQVMEVRKRVLGDQHPDTLGSMGNLSLIYLYQGQWAKAELLQVPVMETRKRELGDEHPDTLTSMGNLSLIYLYQGQWAKAESLEVQVMEMSSRVLGDEHPDTLTSMGNLSAIYIHQKRWAEAELLEAQVMEKRKRVLGDEHPNTLTSIGNLALIYQNQKRLVEAELLEVQAVEIRKRVSGEEHPDTLLSMGNLASTYRDQKRLAEAELLEVQVMEMRKRVLGDEHPDTLTSMGNLGLTYQAQKRLAEAEMLEVQVMETSLRVLGDEHPNTLISMAYLAQTFQDQGRSDEALALLRDCVSRRRRVLGPEHPNTLSSIETLRQWEQDST